MKALACLGINFVLDPWFHLALLVAAAPYIAPAVQAAALDLVAMILGAR